MSMYLEHFGLREAPFRITPHTDFFFDGANRGATLDALIYAITHDEGIVKVTGEVGSGKTMLCRMLLEKLPEHVETVYLANPSLSRDELLYALADELRMPELPERTHQLLRNLQQHLVDLYASGRQVVVIIDEAHAMPLESLEEVRLLSNLESTRHKLLQIVLFGQPELDDILSDNAMRQLRERITHNFALEPLKRTDIGQYINFRLRAAGYHGPDLFTPPALRLIAEASGGLTRRINILADKSLLAAFSENGFQVTPKQAKAAIKDARFMPMAEHGGRGGPAGRLALAGGLAAIALAAGAAAAWMLRDDTATAARPPTEVAPRVAPFVAPPASEPAAAVDTSQSPPTSPPGAQPASTVGGGNPTASANEQPAAGQASAADTPLPLQASPELTDNRGSGELPPLTATRVDAFELWLAGASDDHYFVQLLRTRADAAADVERYLRQVSRQIDGEQLRVYRIGTGKDLWMGVIHGDYPTREAALQAISRLPEPLRLAGAYPRPVRTLRQP